MLSGMCDLHVVYTANRQLFLMLSAVLNSFWTSDAPHLTWSDSYLQFAQCRPQQKNDRVVFSTIPAWKKKVRNEINMTHGNAKTLICFVLATGPICVPELISSYVKGFQSTGYLCIKNSRESI